MIFFDLETSDRDPIGQILNYCFFAVDERFQPLGELTGEVKISRLQLPSIGALLANRVRVLEHQERAQYTEAQACDAIVRFIDDQIAESNEPVALCGYNIFRFDLQYLRTSLIRNGYNPYFRGKIQYRDLLCAVRTLACRVDSFPRPERVIGAEPLESEKPKGPRLSLSLESITRALGLLTGDQTHNARDDVLLTVALADTLRQRFGYDIFKTSAYEGVAFHSRPRQAEIVWALEPEYDLLKSARAIRSPITLLDTDQRSSLWIDLQRYRDGKGRDSISYRKALAGELLLESVPASIQNEWSTVAQAAAQEFREVRLSNYFQTSSCDIEMDIYRVDSAGIELLRQALVTGNAQALKAADLPDLVTLLTRARLARYEVQESIQPRFYELLAEYGRYRYGGGRMQLSRQPAKEPNQTRYAQTARELIAELLAAPAEGKEIANQLAEFYRACEIRKVAPELFPTF